MLAHSNTCAGMQPHMGPTTAMLDRHGIPRRWGHPRCLARPVRKLCSHGSATTTTGHVIPVREPHTSTPQPSTAHDVATTITRTHALASHGLARACASVPDTFPLWCQCWSQVAVLSTALFSSAVPLMRVWTMVLPPSAHAVVLAVCRM